jgi:UDP-galactopyranose mutase
VGRYDWLVVGAGLYGGAFAYFAKARGERCLVVEKRRQLGGNLYCSKVENVNVHQYGPHIFHTDNKKVWNFVNSLVEFNHFRYSPLADYQGKLFNLPFNMNTFYQLWGTITPDQAKKKIDSQITHNHTITPQNLEEQAISLVGNDVYQTLIKGYTEKQWGRKCTDLPAFIIKRLPVRFTFDNNYFDDPYQGVPIGGYNGLVDMLLDGVETKCNTNFFDDRKYFENVAEKILFTGPIDEFYSFQFGNLNYRTVTLETEILNCSNFQGNAVVNYTEKDVPYTRIIEHKHFEFGKQTKTVISKEFPMEWTPGKEPFYPVNDQHNQTLYQKYKSLADKELNVIFGGRLAEYKYYDMDEIIENVMNIFHI